MDKKRTERQFLLRGKRHRRAAQKERFFMADLTFVTVLGMSMKKHTKLNEWLSSKLSWEVSLFAAKTFLLQFSIIAVKRKSLK